MNYLRKLFSAPPPRLLPGGDRMLAPVGDEGRPLTGVFAPEFAVDVDRRRLAEAVGEVGLGEVVTILPAPAPARLLLGVTTSSRPLILLLLGVMTSSRPPRGEMARRTPLLLPTPLSRS